MAFEIEKGVPVPALGRGGRRVLKYPFNEMEVGDSFLVSVGEDSRARVMTRLINAAGHYKPKRFKTAGVPDGVRCWRIA
jgi:hypothetical protein